MGGRLLGTVGSSGPSELKSLQNIDRSGCAFPTRNSSLSTYLEQGPGEDGVSRKAQKKWSVAGSPCWNRDPQNESQIGAILQSGFLISCWFRIPPTVFTISPPLTEYLESRDATNRAMTPSVGME